MNTEELYTKAGLALRRGEAASWEAAEAMAALADMGETQRQIAARLGCSDTTVSRYVQVFRASSGSIEKPSFAEAMAALRTDNAARLSVPRAPEQRAELVAKLLKDKDVADAPVVREVQERHSNRRIRAHAAAWNREHGIPTRAEEEQASRRLSLAHKDMFWFGLVASMRACDRNVTEARREIDRTGLPNRQTREIITVARTLARHLKELEAAATQAGIGEASEVG